jgi:hypothetical protein
MSLRQRLNELASSFASEVLDAIRGASLEDLVAASPVGGRRARPASAAGPMDTAARPARGRRGRLPRRSMDDIAQVVERIVSLLEQNPEGLRAEQIREKLGLQAKELPRPLKESLDSGRVGKSGQKRATTYFVKASGGQASSGGRAERPRRTRARRAPAARRASERARSSAREGNAARAAAELAGGPGMERAACEDAEVSVSSRDIDA